MKPPTFIEVQTTGGRKLYLNLDYICMIDITSDEVTIQNEGIFHLTQESLDNLITTIDNLER